MASRFFAKMERNLNGFFKKNLPGLHALVRDLSLWKIRTLRGPRVLRRFKKNLPLTDRADLGLLLKELHLNGDGVEIGVLNGYYSELLLTRSNLRTLHSVDPWKAFDTDAYDDKHNSPQQEQDDRYRFTQDRLKKFGSRSKIHRMMSAEAAKKFENNSLDFVYIDANHSYEAVKEDLELWWPKVRPGGVIAGHDYLDGQIPEGDFGVKSAVDEFMHKHNQPFSVIPVMWPTWYAVKKSLGGTCIATVLNDPFVEYFCVLLYSIKKHNPHFNLPVKILHSKKLSPLSKENQDRIRNLYPNVEFILVDEEPVKRFFLVTPIRLHPALLKLEIFNLRGYDRVIFLDSDMLCLGDLSNLFNLDVPFAACPAGKNRELKERLANGFHRRIGFNSGVMVIGKEHLDGRTYHALLTSPLKPCPTADQDILMRYFRWKKIYCLDHHYNYHAQFFWKGDEKDVKILHYAGKKPLEEPEEPRMKVWFEYQHAMKHET
ncbi:MAG: hypothetical protein HOO67_04605 [Candidatus Peribacteraceae bacterium]|nr:hypothetical protein [Candidatus Peribacteraceae bacterium]